MTRDIRLMGGPLDGTAFPDPDPSSSDPGAYMVVPGDDRRAVYEPDPDGAPKVWHHRGYIG